VVGHPEVAVIGVEAVVPVRIVALVEVASERQFSITRALYGSLSASPRRTERSRKPRVVGPNG